MTRIEEIQALIKVGEDLTEESQSFTIQIKPKNRVEKFLMKIGLMKTERVFEISPILVGNRERVSTRALKIKGDIFTDGKLDINKCWQSIHEHTNDYIYIIAVCIQNRKKEPSKALIEYLRWINDVQFYKMLDKSLSMAGVPSFMKSTLLIKGSNVLSVPVKDVTLVTDQE